MTRASIGAILTLACLTLVLGGPTDARAQSVGATGGVSAASIKFDDAFAEDTGPQAGWVVGGFAGLGLPAGLRLRVEGLLVEERATVSEIQQDRLRYVEVPVLLRYRVLGSEGRRPVYVNGGVVARRLLRAEETISGESFDIAVRKNDLAWAVGGDIDVAPRLNLAVRYQMSREGTYRRANGSYAGQQRALRVLVGYTFKK